MVTFGMAGTATLAILLSAIYVWRRQEAPSSVVEAQVPMRARNHSAAVPQLPISNPPPQDSMQPVPSPGAISPVQAAEPSISAPEAGEPAPKRAARKASPSAMVPEEPAALAESSSIPEPASDTPIATSLPLDPLDQRENTVRELASISHASIASDKYFVQLATGISSFGLSQGQSTENSLDYAVNNGKAFGGRVGYAPSNALGSELGFSSVSGKIASKNPSDDLRYQASTFSAEAVYPFAYSASGANTFEANIRGGLFHFATPFIVNDGDQLYVQRQQSLAAGVGLGAKVRIGKNWMGEAVIRSQRPFTQSSDNDRFNTETKILFDSFFSASYISDGGLRVGLALSQQYQARRYELQQLDGVKEHSDHTMKALGANAIFGLDF